MKTFNDIKIGDYIYRYYITWLSFGDGKDLFYEGLRRNIKEYKVVDVDDDYIYVGLGNGTRIAIPRNSSCVQLNPKDNCTEYCMKPFSTYNFYRVPKAEKDELCMEWNAMIHNRMNKYCKNICNKIYSELGISDEYSVDGDVRLEVIEREVIKDNYIVSEYNNIYKSID